MIINESICFFFGHKIQWYNPQRLFPRFKPRKRCVRCGAEFGIPEMQDIPPIPKIKNDTAANH
jgi:hypothetical protein